MAMTLHLTEDETRRLHARAKAEGTSEQDVALAAIRHYLEGETQTDAGRDAVAEVKLRYASSLKRLGE